MTLVVTTADLRVWEGRARQFAVLKDKRLVVLGTWEKLEAASEELLHELLTAERGLGKGNVERGAGSVNEPRG